MGKNLHEVQVQIHGRSTRLKSNHKDDCAIKILPGFLDSKHSIWHPELNDLQG